MRIHLPLWVALITLMGCGGKIDPKPQGQSQPSRPNPKIVRHKIEEHPAVNAIMKQELLPAVLEVEVANSGGSGNVRIHVEQGQKSWEERVHFGAREQRKVRVSLPNADPGFVRFGAEADPPASPVLPVEPQPKAEGFWDQFLQRILLGGIIGAAVGVLIALFKRHGRQPRTQADSPFPSGAEVRREAVCSICGTPLRGGDLSAGLCGSCQRRSAGV
jgi:hypothetical protein